MSKVSELMKRERKLRTLRRHRWSFEELLLRPRERPLWMPRIEGCEKCFAAYPIDEQRHVMDQVVGQLQAGPRCHTCGHCIKREELVEYHDRKYEVGLLISCHGDEELHVLDLGSVEWHVNSTNPGDTLQMVREMRMALPAFLPNVQGEKGTVGLQ